MEQQRTRWTAEIDLPGYRPSFIPRPAMPFDMTENRKTILLKACYDMLKKCNESGFVVSPMETTVHYDEADCDGLCLMDDIASELGIEKE